MKTKIKHFWGKKHFRYSFYLALALGLIFFISSIVAITLFAVLPPKAVYLLADMPVPSKSDRILILSPHPDDETIAAGGYIHYAIENGAQVKIALVTDGNKHGLRDIRYKEFKEATGKLGVPEGNLEFWDFKDGIKNDSQYSGIEKMIAGDIKRFQPTIIVAPMTQDAHYDHYLVGKAYLEARNETNYSGQQYGYLVHHRYYPQPKKYSTDSYLSPPIRYLTYGQGWVKIILPSETIDDKNSAVLDYKSQLQYPTLNSLLKSMIRKDEIFVRLD